MPASPVERFMRSRRGRESVPARASNAPCAVDRFMRVGRAARTARPRARPARPDASGSPQEREDRQYQEHEEENLGDAGRARGDTAEAEDGRHDGNDEEDDGVMKHLDLQTRGALAFVGAGMLAWRAAPPYRKPP